ncbi:FKBP12-associated protein [Trapelia coarctata]|nr:FKBP12-associated protein [Trapelia coarctata]
MLITCDCQHLKQETKCNASKASEGNTKKTLKCDDECARLERNRKLALALNIDPETHKDDHIPYATATLTMYSEFPKWAQTQEREFRVFAADTNEKRLRFKPMPAHQRAFIHALAEDFGFDSESTDPEPHRHVYVFKTLRFVASPMKTLAECVRIRALASTAAAESATGELQPRRTTVGSNEPFNGFLLTGPRFALTIEELRVELAGAFATVPAMGFEISFLPSEHIVLKAHPASAATNIPPSSLDALLKSLKPALSALVGQKHLAASIHLVALDGSLNLLRREADKAIDEDGWSQVAAKAAAPRFAKRVLGVGEKSAFMVLGSRGREKEKEKKKREKEKEVEVVENWEEEMRREEEEEGVMGRAEEEVRSGTLGIEEGEGKDVVQGAEGAETLGKESQGEEEVVPAHGEGHTDAEILRAEGAGGAVAVDDATAVGATDEVHA